MQKTRAKSRLKPERELRERASENSKAPATINTNNKATRARRQRIEKRYHSTPLASCLNWKPPLPKVSTTTNTDAHTLTARNTPPVHAKRVYDRPLLPVSALSSSSVDHPAFPAEPLVLTALAGALCQSGRVYFRKLFLTLRKTRSPANDLAPVAGQFTAVATRRRQPLRSSCSVSCRLRAHTAQLVC